METPEQITQASTGPSLQSSFQPGGLAAHTPQSASPLHGMG
jgi:hypothetical protein